MGRLLSFCVLAVLFGCLSGCGDAPSRPSVITDSTVSPAKTSARYIQAPWDISLPGATLGSGAAVAATAGDNLTGTFVNSNGFAGTLTGVLTGTLERGTFTGSLKTITPSGCLAERQFTGSVTTQTLHWSPGPHLNDCGGASPLTASIQAAAAPSTAPPCTYSSVVSETSVQAAGGTGTVTVTAGAGCTWFATSSDSFVTLSASEGTGDGSVNFTVAPNTTIAPRTATLVVAGESFTVTQAAAGCAFTLSESGRTVDPEGGNSAIEMRTLAGCAWQASSDVRWLIVRNTSGTGTGPINFAVESNPDLSQRTGTITAAGQRFTVTHNGITCGYTVTPPATTAFPTAGGSGTVGVATPAACAWAATSSVPWITITPPPGATGPGSVAFTVAANTEPAARTGTVTVAGQAIAITQAAAPCVFTLTPWTTTVTTEGWADIGVTTHNGCAWTANATAIPAWITITGAASGQGNGTVRIRFAANTTGQPRTGVVTIGNASGNASAAFTEAGTLGSLTGTVTNILDNQPVANTVVFIDGPGGLSVFTDSSGRYFMNPPTGTFYVVMGGGQRFLTDGGRVTISAGQTTTFNIALTPVPVHLYVSWNPSPVSVNPNDPGCGAGDRYCWSSTVTIGEAGLGPHPSTAHVNTWVVRFYNPDGTLDSAATQTRTGAEFAEQFGANPIPAQWRVASPRQVTLSHARGGAVDYVISGVDNFGRAFSFTSPRLVLNPFGSTGTLTSVPSAPAAGPASDEGPANPASNTIRRR